MMRSTAHGGRLWPLRFLTAAMTGLLARAAQAQSVTGGGGGSGSTSPDYGVTWAMLSPGNDWAAKVIQSVFPVFGHSAGANGIGAEATVIGTMLGDLSGFVMAIGMTYVTYAWFMHSHRAAETSRLLGTNQTSMSIIRIAFAAIMMFPVANGFSAGQALVVQGSLWSLGMARAIYTQAVDALGPGGKVIAAPLVPGTMTIVSGAVEAEFCRDIVNLASNNANLIQNPVSEKPWIGGNVIQYRYQMAQGSGTATCGTVSMTAPTAATSVLGVKIDNAEIQKNAFDQVLLNDIQSQVQGVATQFWNTKQTATLAPLIGIIVNATNAYTQALTAQAQAIRVQLQTAVTNNSYTLDDYGNMGNTSSTNMNQLTALGWTGAGAYYLEFARLNGETLSIMADTPSVTQPTFEGLGVSLSHDVLPMMQSASTFIQNISDTATTQDGSSTPGGYGNLFNGVQPNGDGTGILSGLARTLHLTDSVLESGMSFMEPTTSPYGGQSGYWIDPFGNLMALGNWMITTALVTVGAAAALSSGPVTTIAVAGALITGDVPAALGAGAGHVAMSFLGTPIIAGCMALLIPGLTLTFVLPMIPWVMWMAAVASWLILVCEAMIAVPLWMLAHMTVNGEGLHGHARAGYALIFNILFRPTLMLFGLFLSYFVFDAMAYLIHMTFGIAAGFVLSKGWFVTNLLGVVVLMGMFVMVHVVLALICFRLISILPDKVPAMIGFEIAGRIDTDQFARDAGVVGMGAALKSIEGSLHKMMPDKDKKGGAAGSITHDKQEADTTLAKTG